MMFDYPPILLILSIVGAIVGGLFIFVSTINAIREVKDK